MPQWVGDGVDGARELSARLTELSTLMGISSLLSSENPLSESLETVCRLGAEICRAEVAFIHLADGEDDLVCVARQTSTDPLQYAWEGITRIYGRKSIQKGQIISCSNILLRTGGEVQDQRTPRMGGICAIPLKGKTRMVGAMAIGYSGVHRFTAREKDVLSAIASQVAMAVERSWLIDQLQEQLARANTLREAGAHVGSNLELDQVLDSIVNHASSLLAAEFSAIFLVDEPGNGTPADGQGLERGKVHGAPMQLDSGPLGMAVRQAAEMGRPAVVQRRPRAAAQEAPSESRPSDYQVALAVPLSDDQEVLGALVMCYLERRRFDASDISVAETFARQATIAIRNARLYEEALEHRLSMETAINQINNHGISVLDEALNIRFANPATFWLLGVSPRARQMPFDGWVSLLKKALVDGSDLDRLVERIRSNPEETVIARLQVRGSGDAPRALRLSSLPLRQMDGSVRGRVNVLEEGTIPG